MCKKLIYLISFVLLFGLALTSTTSPKTSEFSQASTQ